MTDKGPANDATPVQDPTPTDGQEVDNSYKQTPAASAFDMDEEEEKQESFGNDYDQTPADDKTPAEDKTIKADETPFQGSDSEDAEAELKRMKENLAQEVGDSGSENQDPILIRKSSQTEVAQPQIDPQSSLIEKNKPPLESNGEFSVPATPAKMAAKQDDSDFSDDGNVEVTSDEDNIVANVAVTGTTKDMRFSSVKKEPVKRKVLCHVCLQIGTPENLERHIAEHKFVESSTDCNLFSRLGMLNIPKTGSIHIFKLLELERRLGMKIKYIFDSQGEDLMKIDSSYLVMKRDNVT